MAVSYPLKYFKTSGWYADVSTAMKYFSAQSYDNMLADFKLAIYAASSSTCSLRFRVIASQSSIVLISSPTPPATSLFFCLALSSDAWGDSIEVGTLSDPPVTTFVGSVDGM